MKFYNKLECVLRYLPAKTGRVKEVTEIAVFLGPLLVAQKMVGGTYDQEQSMAEFRRNHRMFTKGPAYESAKSLGLFA